MVGRVFTLYTAGLSANGRKVVALTRQLGLAADVVEVDVYRGEGRAPEFLALNPAGKVPTLVDGALVLWESNAILLYISEAWGQSRMWSRDPKVRADIARWMFWESAHWQPVLTAVLGPHAGYVMVPNLVGQPADEPEWDAPALVPLLRKLDAHLREHEYLARDALSLADFAVAAMTIYFRRLGFPFADYPALTDWYGRIHAQPGWQATHADPWIP